MILSKKSETPLSLGVNIQTVVFEFNEAKHDTLG